MTIDINEKGTELSEEKYSLEKNTINADPYFQMNTRNVHGVTN
jgi:hypothetical protein